MKARWRVKRGWFGRSKVVLQLGFSQTWHYGMPVAVVPYTTWVWRDATEEDLIDRILGEAKPARDAVDFLFGRTEPAASPMSKTQLGGLSARTQTPATCPAQQASTTETENT